MHGGIGSPRRLSSTGVLDCTVLGLGRVEDLPYQAHLFNELRCMGLILVVGHGLFLSSCLCAFAASLMSCSCLVSAQCVIVSRFICILFVRK